MIATSLDALIDKQFAPLQGRRIGLMTNQSAISRDGIPAVIMNKASMRGAVRQSNRSVVSSNTVPPRLNTC